MLNILLVEGVQSWLERSNMDNPFARYFLIVAIMIFFIFLLRTINVPSIIQGFFIVMILMLAIFLGLIGLWVAIGLSVFGFIFMITVIKNKIYF